MPTTILENWNIDASIYIIHSCVLTYGSVLGVFFFSITVVVYKLLLPIIIVYKYDIYAEN